MKFVAQVCGSMQKPLRLCGVKTTALRRQSEPLMCTITSSYRICASLSAVMPRNTVSRYRLSTLWKSSQIVVPSPEGRMRPLGIMFSSAS